MRTLRHGAAWLAVLFTLLAWAGPAAAQASNTAGVTGSPSEPPAIAKLRSNQDRTATALRDEARAMLAASTDPTLRAWATFAVAEFENDLENAPAALELLAAVKVEAQRLGLIDLAFAALDREANLLVNRGKSVETDAVLVQMQKLVDETNDPRMRAQLLHDRGVLERKLGRFDKALVYFEQARDIQRRVGDSGAVAREINSIGMLQGRTGKFSEAVLAHNEALELSQKAGDRAETARSLRLLGVLYRNLDDEERGSQYLRQALDYVEERNKREAIALHGELARSLALLGRIDDAAAHAEQAVTLAEASGSPPNKVNAYTRMADLLLDQGISPKPSAGRSARSSRSTRSRSATRSCCTSRARGCSPSSATTPRRSTRHSSRSRPRGGSATASSSARRSTCSRSSSCAWATPRTRS
jgi:tetratricopeptide (TPR) repeat protein